jgi:hypothetical protein
VPLARIATTIAQGLLIAVVGLVALLAGGVVVVASTVGVCAAVVALLWGVADVLAYLFGISFRWGFVSATALALVCTLAGALINDVRMIRGLASPTTSPAPKP